MASQYKRRIQDGLTYEQSEALALREMYAGALRRLRFYYPDVYASLSGDDLAKRQAFEQEEAKERADWERPTSPTTVEGFINELTTLNCRIPGVSDRAIAPGFLVEDGSMNPRFCNTAVHNLLAEGVQSLPALLRHLDDKRPTMLVIGRDQSRKSGAPGGQFFAEEYDARRHAWPFPACGADKACSAKRPFEKPYTVKVGDVCFVLIGQIVNRQLNAVRYQPTAIVTVNSPIETPALAKLPRADWAGVDS